MRRADPADPPRADVVVWACGAWLPQLFPGLVELKISRRDVFFLGVDGSWAGMPGFCDYDSGFYGHGELGGLGMKVAPDRPASRSTPTRSSASRCPRTGGWRASTPGAASPPSPARP